MADLILPAGYRRHLATEDLIPEAARHLREVLIAESGRPLVSEQDLAAFWRSPTMDLSHDVALVRDDGGALVAQAVFLSRPPHTDPGTFGVVGPDHTGRGLGTALVQWAGVRASERFEEAPPDAQVALTAYVDAAHRPSVELMEGNGLILDRYFITMEIEFDGPVPAAHFPDGIELRPFTVDQLEDAVATAGDAFRDHYGYVDRPEEARLAEVRHALEQPRFDAGLWWHLYEGDEMVANCWCYGESEGDESVGYVQSLGVRKPWRGRGLARNLLLHAFAEFQRRGKRKAALDVDAHSLTGATRLYESVGMTETFRNATYTKVLRPGVDLANRGG